MTHNQGILASQSRLRGAGQDGGNLIPQQVRAHQPQGQEKQEKNPWFISDVEDVERIPVEVEAR